MLADALASAELWMTPAQIAAALGTMATAAVC